MTWTEMRLGDCVQMLSGGTPSKSVPGYWGGDIPWLSAKDMKRPFVHDTEDHVTPTGAENGTRRVPPGALLVLVRGMTLLNDVPTCMAMRAMTFNQDVKGLLPLDHVDARFLHYAVMSRKQELLSAVELAGHGTGVLPTDRLKNLLLGIPPLQEQRAIAKVLGDLDDKIELNRRMNETLEAMVRALFKSWFVDFDPVRAKMEGRKPAFMDEETAALFPDKLVESELGEIPAGWSVGMLKGVTSKIGSGATPRGGASVYQDDGVAFIRSQNVYDGQFEWRGLARISEEAASDLAGVTVQQNDVLMNITGDSILRTMIVDPAVLPARVSQHVAILRPNTVNAEYLYQYLVRSEAKEGLIGMDAGGTRQAITKGGLEAFPIIVPAGSVLGRFQEVVGPLRERMFAHGRESQTLAQLRDVLLPRLLSGELRVAA